MANAIQQTPLTGSARAFRIILLAVLLSVAWLLWSGFFKPLLLALGAVSVFLTLWLVQRVGYFRNDLFALRYDFRLLPFWLWLTKEIVLSSLQVTRTVLSPNPKIAPRTVSISVEALEAVDQALLGNSVTLTPGTLALDLYEGRLLVHTLNDEGAKALLAGDMYRKVAALRGL